MRGLPREQIKSALLGAGWPADQAQAALDSFADVEFPLPVPRPSPYLSAREAFLYLVLFSMLYVTASSFGALLFRFIEIALPDPAQPLIIDEGVFSSMRRSVSCLIVAFPIFLYLSILTSREVAKDPTKRGSRVRRWLTYLTLFVAASVLIGDLMTLVYNLLGGELTLRFVLEVATVGAIGGTIFGYYLSDLRREEREA